MNRSMAREIALKRLVAQALGGEGDADSVWNMTISEAAAEREEKARKAAQNPEDKDNVQESGEEEELPKKLSNRDRKFSNDIFVGVTLYSSKLDEIIASHSQKWSIERIDCVDLCALRMASYEIFLCPDIPMAASINEAVELAKIFGAEKSSAFVNGILGSIARSNGGERPKLSFADEETEKPGVGEESNASEETEKPSVGEESNASEETERLSVYDQEIVPEENLVANGEEIQKAQNEAEEYEIDSGEAPAITLEPGEDFADKLAVLLQEVVTNMEPIDYETFEKIGQTDEELSDDISSEES